MSSSTSAAVDFAAAAAVFTVYNRFFFVSPCFRIRVLPGADPEVVCGDDLGLGAEPPVEPRVRAPGGGGRFHHTVHRAFHPIRIYNFFRL